MNEEDKIKELQDKIYDLSDVINASLSKLRLLQGELNDLRNEKANGSAGHPVPSVNSETKRVAATSAPRGIEHFIGLKLIHLVGIIVLVTGISIGVKYAIDQELISEEFRIILAYAAGLLLFILSIRLKKKYLLFSAILFSGSMASIYFTTYAAFVYYQFIPAIIAFLLMVGLTVYTAIMATGYDRKEIAIIGMIGAYGIPFLISANAERVELFFSYILLINLGVVFLSLKKGWKLMNQVALLVTWLLFIGWSVIRFDGSQQWVAIIFMSLYFLLFIFSVLGWRISRNTALSWGDLQQVVVNNTVFYIAAIIVFNKGSLQAEPGIATGCMFIVTALLALISSRIFSSELLLLRSLVWQSLVLLLLFIAFQWDGLTVTLLWVAVSVLLFAWGVYGQKSWARLAAVLLIGITLGKLLVVDSERFSTLQKISCYIIIGILLLLFSFYYQKLGLSKKQDS